MPLILSGSAGLSGNVGTTTKEMLPVGSVLQVVQSVKTDIFSSSSTSYVDIPGLIASITPYSLTSRIKVEVALVGGGSPVNILCMFRLVRNSTPIAVGDAASGFYQATVGNQRSSYDTNSAFNLSSQFVDTPNSVAAVTYKLQGQAEGGVFKVNGAGADNANSIWSARSISSIILTEIKA